MNVEESSIFRSRGKNTILKKCILEYEQVTSNK